jgi:hypothetical protein
VGVGVGVPEGEGVGVGDPEGVGLGLALGVAEGEGVGVADELGVAVGVDAGDALGVGLFEGAMATGRLVGCGRAAKNRGGRLKVGTRSQKGARGSSAK